MNSEMYKFIENNEGSHWWFNGREDIIRMFLLSYCAHYDTVLDIGCGSGHFLKSIMDISTDRFGIDEHSYSTADHSVKEGDARGLPFENSSMDLITMLDVLEHIPESDTVLEEVHRVLDHNGLFLLTVPAFQFLYSPHDKSNHHVKRYGKKELCGKLKRNGFEVLRCSYFNTYLFPLEAAIRLFEKIINKEISVPTSKNVGGGDTLTNKLLYRIFHSETKLLKNHDFPYGLSLIAVARLKDEEVLSKNDRGIGRMSG